MNRPNKKSCQVVYSLAAFFIGNLMICYCLDNYSSTGLSHRSASSNGIPLRFA